MENLCKLKIWGQDRAGSRLGGGSRYGCSGSQAIENKWVTKQCNNSHRETEVVVSTPFNLHRYAADGGLKADNSAICTGRVMAASEAAAGGDFALFGIPRNGTRAKMPEKGTRGSRYAIE